MTSEMETLLRDIEVRTFTKPRTLYDEGVKLGYKPKVSATASLPPKLADKVPQVSRIGMVYIGQEGLERPERAGFCRPPYGILAEGQTYLAVVDDTQTIVWLLGQVVYRPGANRESPQVLVETARVQDVADLAQRL